MSSILLRVFLEKRGIEYVINSELSDVHYSPNQFLAQDFFGRFLQQDGSD